MNVDKIICDYCWANINKIRDNRLEHHFCNTECYYNYKRSQKKYCKKCGKEISKPYNDYNKRCYCCRSCFEYDFANTTCVVYWKPFYVRPDTLKKWTKIWFTCSRECSNEIRKQYYLWNKNPNYKWKKYTRDWYSALWLLPKIGSVKINNIVMQIVLWIPKTPKWYQIHHRDCDVNNNSPENLALLTINEHTYLHKMMWKIWLISYSKWLIDNNYINNIIDDWWKIISIIGKSFLTQNDDSELIWYKWNANEMFYNSNSVIESIEEIAETLHNEYWVDVFEFISNIKNNKK